MCQHLRAAAQSSLAPSWWQKLTSSCFHVNPHKSRRVVFSKTELRLFYTMHDTARCCSWSSLSHCRSHISTKWTRLDVSNVLNNMRGNSTIGLRTPINSEACNNCCYHHQPFILRMYIKKHYAMAIFDRLMTWKLNRKQTYQHPLV